MTDSTLSTSLPFFSDSPFAFCQSGSAPNAFQALSFASLLCGSTGHKSCRATPRRQVRWEQPQRVRARVCEQRLTKTGRAAAGAILTFQLDPELGMANARNDFMAVVETLPRDRGTVLAEERTDLALDRTVLAAERTLMAWIRTSLSMIGFGFTIFKFFQYLPEEIATGNIQRPQAPRNLGLTLIALGTVTLVVAAWQHRNFLGKANSSQMQPSLSLSFVVAIAVILIGAIAFYGVLLRHGPF